MSMISSSKWGAVLLSDRNTAVLLALRPDVCMAAGVRVEGVRVGMVPGGTGGGAATTCRATGV